MGLRQLTGSLASRTFGSKLRFTKQFPDCTLRFAGNLFCDAFYLVALHDSQNLRVCG